MPELPDLKEEIRNKWASLPAAELCVLIIDYVVALMPNQAEMLTFSTFCHATGKEKPDADLITAVGILANSNIDILDAHAMLIDEDLETEINPEDLAEARQTGELIHPLTGLPVENFESHLLPFFVPSQKLRDYAK
jgi:hypothetical protein